MPIASLIWLIIVAVAVYISVSERNYRYKNVERELTLINERIIDMEKNGYDVNRFLRFVERFYRNDTLHNELEGLRVSIFEKGNDFPVRFLGQPLFNSESDMDQMEKDSYYCMVFSNPANMSISVRTALPYNIHQWKPENSGFWILIIIIGLAATTLTYVMSSHLARNVTLLSEFTERASTDQGFQPNANFPDDELGDISRRIVEIYNERKVAQAEHEREHAIALKASEEQSRLKRQIANNVNHELKTPVGIIRGYIDTLVQNPDMDKEQRDHFLQKTSKQVGRLVAMLDDLSTLTRLDDASGMIPTHEVNMNELLATLDEEIYESGIGGDLTFVYELPDNCIVRGSESLINAAILNFVKNSAAYSGGCEMGFICTGEDDNFYSFSFFDNGKGLGDEHLPKIFDRFYRVESGRSRKTGGTGLGLSIVKSTITSMGGSIVARNREEGGLEFSFTLPKWK